MKHGLLSLALVVSLVGCAEGLPNLETGNSAVGEPAPLSEPQLIQPAAISEFHWSYNGIIAGKTCIAMHEPDDPYAWEDNYLCTDRDFRLTWLNAGAANSGPNCTRMFEDSGLAAWDNNFLCAASDIGLRWSNAGPIAGMQCLKINEPSEPTEYTWEDNYLCLPQ